MEEIKFPSAETAYLKFYPEEELLLPIAQKVLTVLRDNSLNYMQCEFALRLVHRELLGCQFVLSEEKL